MTEQGILTIHKQQLINELRPPPARLAWAIWGLGAVLFLIGFYLRVAPAVMTEELMNDFKLNATALGNLSAFYFYSYVAMQIPTGILVDTWGPRRLLTLGALLTGLGTLLFALAPTILWAGLGRLLIGGAVAVAFVGGLKLAGHWLDPRQFALSTGLALFVGICGAILAGVPLQLSITAYGWRPVMVVSALLPLAMSIAIWWIVRDDPQEQGYTSYAHAEISTTRPRSTALTGIVEILRYRNVWLLSLIPGAFAGSVLTFAGLWGIPFLTTHYGLTATSAAAVTSTLLVAWAISGPLFGVLSDRIGRRKPLYLIGCALAGLSWSIIIFAPNLPRPIFILLLIGAGLASGCMIIGYAFVKESVPPHLAGTVSGMCNMGVLLGPMLLQPGVGWILDQRWQGELVNGIRSYNLAAYQAGFSLMLAWLVLAFGLLFLTKETRCRQQF